MNATHHIGTLLFATALLACGGPQSPQSPPPTAPSNTGAPSAASSTSPAKPGGLESPGRRERAALDAPVDPAAVVAKVKLQAGERDITYAELSAWAESRRAANESVRWPTTFDDFAGRLLLADEAKRHDMAEPADELLRAEAWSKKQFLPDAEASVTDADLQAAFTERRSAVRVMSRSEDDAKSLKATLADKVSAAATIQDKVVTFKTRGGTSPSPRRDDATIAPQGALFDAQGKGDAGQAVVPPKVAEMAFKLTTEGEVSDPVEIATGRWVLVMLTGVRPGTPLDKVPPEVRERAKEGLVTTRAMNALRDRVARLRRDAPVVILDDRIAQKALGLTADDLRASRVRKLPFDTHKMRMDQLRGGRQQRIPGVEPRDVPGVDRVNPDKVKEGMQK